MTDAHAGKPRYDEHFIPLEPLDINSISSFDDLLRAMDKTAFAGRQTGEAADILSTMVKDQDCFVVGTFSGAMSVAKMGLLITEMIDRKMVQAVVSTGALMAHGLIEGIGKPHFKYDTSMDDASLYEHGYDRVYDTLETEKNFDELWDVFLSLFENADASIHYSSSRICRMIGDHLIEKSPYRAILRSAAKQNIPVYIPAFTDSELGMDFALVNRTRERRGLPQLTYNPLIDLDHFADVILAQKRIGIFTIGGGVPRNWAQQVCPYLDSIRYLFRDDGDASKYYADRNDPYNKLYRYAVRICPEPVHWGGLSGCTYTEGVSWGKFVPQKDGGRFAEVMADATAVWPLIIKGVIERMEKDNLPVADKRIATVPIR